jgi:hypothetical protein
VSSATAKRTGYRATSDCPVSFAERWLRISAGLQAPALVTGISGGCFQLAAVVKQDLSISRRMDGR